MDKFVIITGNIVDEDKSEFLKEVSEICNLEEQNASVYFIKMGDQKSEDTERFLEKSLNCEVITMMQHQQNQHIHAVYEIKKQMDKSRTVNCYFVLPFCIHRYYADICSLLFPPMYNIKCAQTKHLSLEDNSAEFESGVELNKKVQNYLHTVPASDPVTIYQSKIIPSAFVHGYSSRPGGISSFPDQASLNLCYSQKKRDSMLVVMENKSRLSQAGGFDRDRFYAAKAVHGRDVWVFEEEEPPSYDAIVTNTRGVTVAAPGADCNMVLFADPVTQSCGAAHAGWKGILAGIVQSSVASMVDKYKAKPKDILVSIGPSLGVCCCEFGAEESKKFLAISDDCVVWKNRSPKPFLDLRLAVKILLKQEGVLPQNIDDGNITSDLQRCTKCDPHHDFFSFRRVGSQFGNQVGFIGLPE